MKNVFLHIAFFCFMLSTFSQESLSSLLEQYNTNSVPYISVQELAMPKTQAVILENSEAMVRLPEVDYNLMYRGDRSRFNNEPTKQKTIKIYPEGGSSNCTIIINAKFSHIVMQ